LEHWPRFLTLPARGDQSRNKNPIAPRPLSRLTEFFQTPAMSTLEAREKLLQKRGAASVRDR